MILLALTALALIALVAIRPQLVREVIGKILIFLALFVIPAVATIVGIRAHVEHSKETEFCLSCHTMEDYGRSLYLADSAALPAAHYQNNLVPRHKACFACHTTYTMYGDMRAKMQGLRHVWKYYLGSVPEELGLYRPYSNRECLYCHEMARSYLEQEDHAELAAELTAGEMSCLDCHDLYHPVGELDEYEMWERPSP